MVCLENTHNRCSGRGAHAGGYESRWATWPTAPGCRCIWTGPRIFNAAVALEVPPAALAADVDDLSFCLSKSLSCPVGSVLVGSQGLYRAGEALAQDAGAAA